MREDTHYCRTFVEVPSFISKWNALRLTDDDLLRLQMTILSDPKAGAVIRGTGGVRKLRFAFDNQGKSGSSRVIYVDFAVHEKVFLLAVYTKAEKDNLTPAERNELKALVTALRSTMNPARKKEKQS